MDSLNQRGMDDFDGSLKFDVKAAGSDHADILVSDNRDKLNLRSELLCFVQQKCGVIVFDQLVRICADFYKPDEIFVARSLLDMFMSKRLPKRQGVDKVRTTMEDILKVCLDPCVGLPTFHAVDLCRLPPVDIEHCDVSAILKELHALRKEVRELADLRAEVAVFRAQQSITNSADPALSKDIAELKAQHVELARRMDAVVNAHELHCTTSTNAVSDRPGSCDQSIAERDAEYKETSNGPSFAALASSLKSTDMATTKMSTKKKPLARLPVVGRSTTASKLKSVVTRRPVDMFVSRLHPDTEPSDLLNCVKDVLGEDCGDIECNKLKVKYTELYASYHISVSTDVRNLKRVIDLLNAADSWPEGVLVRRFFKPKDG